jgi:hypothetical protein
MTLYRSLVLGLLGACLVLLAHHGNVETHTIREVRRAPVVQATLPAPTLIDVSSQMSPDQLVSLIRLAPGEHISSLDDHHAYLDVTVQSARSERRVLVLVH